MAGNFIPKCVCAPLWWFGVMWYDWLLYDMISFWTSKEKHACSQQNRHVFKTTRKPWKIIQKRTLNLWRSTEIRKAGNFIPKRVCSPLWWFGVMWYDSLLYDMISFLTPNEKHASGCRKTPCFKIGASPCSEKHAVFWTIGKRNVKRTSDLTSERFYPRSIWAKIDHCLPIVDPILGHLKCQKTL